MSIIDDKLFVYLLPGFMIESLSDDTGMWMNIVNRMAPPWKKGGRPRLVKGMECLASDQKAVIRAFLKEIALCKDPKDNVRRRLESIITELSKT